MIIDQRSLQFRRIGTRHGTVVIRLSFFRLGDRRGYEDSCSLRKQTTTREYDDQLCDVNITIQCWHIQLCTRDSLPASIKLDWYNQLGTSISQRHPRAIGFQRDLFRKI